VSGFVDGKLIYIIEFPFNSPDFVKNLENKIKKWEAKLSGSVSTKGQFLRGAGFDYKDFINSPNFKIVYLLNKGELVKYQSFISKGFYEFLYKMAQ